MNGHSTDDFDPTLEEYERAAQDATAYAELVAGSLIPDDPRIFNRRQPDGTFRPLARYFDAALDDETAGDDELVALYGDTPAPAGVCPTCGGEGGRTDWATGNFATCPDCIGDDRCPQCMTDMDMRFDEDFYPIDATCPACGYKWEF